MSLTELDPRQRATLLSIARESIERHLKRAPHRSGEDPDPRLARPAAAFVTLTRDGSLRGCVGYVEPRFPLWEAVARSAVAAATEDYRFPPVQLEELPKLTISISVLTPLRQLDRLEHLEIGRHGLVVARGDRRGVLLPHVAMERGWDRETFVKETCRKAGLEEPLRTEELALFVFEADLFTEDRHAPPLA